MTAEDLLGEVEDLIRTMPNGHDLMQADSEVLAWQGRAAAVMHAIDVPMGHAFDLALAKLPGGATWSQGVRDVPRLLHQARHRLRMQTVGPISSAIGAGAVFDYFDEVRKIIETASSDVFFVDPYLGPEFVSRYLPHVKAGVAVRLLSRKGIEQLLPAVAAFASQHKRSIAVRTSDGMHDRFVFVDSAAVYQSGASFQDGAKKAPTTLTQIVDAFAEVQKQYEDRWVAGAVHM